jgi:hypothetical protein
MEGERRGRDGERIRIEIIEETEGGRRRGAVNQTCYS